MSKSSEKTPTNTPLRPINSLSEDWLCELQKKIEDIPTFHEEVQNVASILKYVFFIQLEIKKGPILTVSNHVESQHEP